jgi:hypothetical protein
METALRIYSNSPRRASEILTVENFNLAVEGKELTKWDGHGYWMKDGMESDDMVFSDPQIDATHVSWYNK